jgi:DNA helicase II / ATP-dependent DNA helicase PcrA
VGYFAACSDPVPNEVPAWLQGLEGTARRIAELVHSPIRVLAGPGTGKTFSLMRRVARLLHEQVPAHQILVCTFTRTAAHDLEDEVSLLGEGRVERVVTGTIHGFCFRLLSREDVLPLTGRVPRPLLTFEERFMVQDLRGDGFGGFRERQRRLRAFNAAWARLQSEDPGWPHDPVDQRFHEALLSWLRFHRAMLIGELIPVTLRFLVDNPASPHRRRFQHVLVDEFQDLNRAEQVLLDLLAEAGSLTVIGDEDQSIYSFKYAHPEGIAQFHVAHPGTHDENLTECRRCPRLVVELANSLIAHNPGRQPRRLEPSPANPAGEVQVVQWNDMEDEAQGIAQFIQGRIVAGRVQAGTVLVLSPRRQFGYAIRNALNARGVHAISFFHEEALDGNPHVLADSQAQQSYSLLTLLGSPEDRVALRCWCGFGSGSLHSPGWARLRRHCEATGDSPRRGLERLLARDLAMPYTEGVIERFRELLLREAVIAGLTGPALVDALFPAGEAWSEPFRSIASSIDDPDYSALRLLDSVRVAITQPELPTDVDYVRIMSLHKSKGLTADLVAIVGCIEGLMPSIDYQAPADIQQASLEEQRRLFYVAITRTRTTLVLSSVRRLPRDLAWKIGAQVRGGDLTHAGTITTRFLAELGPSLPRAATELEG